MRIFITIFITISAFLSACRTDDSSNINDENQIVSNDEMASIVSVTSSGTENNYTLNVGISSPDTGCNQYADWWEVITEDGMLLYRRILAHSHVDEQPFVRSGGPIAITNNQIVIIRAHMNTSGYGLEAFKGSIDSGFISTNLAEDFAQELANASPLPSGCAF